MKILALVFMVVYVANVNAESCTSGTTPDQAACLDAQGVVLVKQLEAAYNRALSYAASTQPNGAPDLKKALTKSQANWWKYRESECEARQVQYWGGTGATYVLLDCMNGLTDQRIKELKTYWSK